MIWVWQSSGAMEQSASPGQLALCLRSAREFVNKVQARLGTIEGIDEVLERLAVGADPDSLPRVVDGSGQCNAGFAGDDDSGGGHCADHSDVSSSIGYDNGCDDSGGYDAGGYNSRWRDSGGYGNCRGDSASCDSGGYDDGGANS